ncbi:MAG: hypothetical protein P8L31_10705, partial [Pseudomonadales bacterium]|nr:hypothetical protein [Pseudomonadales bacterium]
AEVERATAAYLRPYLTVAVSENDEAKAREAARKRVAGLTISSWQDLVQASLPIVEAALKIMKQAEEHAPNELLSVYGTYRAHEQALADYLHAQQNGAPGDHFLFSYLTLLRRESAQASR